MNCYVGAAISHYRQPIQACQWYLQPDAKGHQSPFYSYVKTPIQQGSSWHRIKYGDLKGYNFDPEWVASQLIQWAARRRFRIIAWRTHQVVPALQHLLGRDYGKVFYGDPVDIMSACRLASKTPYWPSGLKLTQAALERHFDCDLCRVAGVVNAPTQAASAKVVWEGLQALFRA